MISDHLSLLVKLHAPKPPLVTKEVTYRKLKSIDIEAFSRDLLELDFVVSPPEDLRSLINGYNRTLSELLDSHAPEKTRLMVDRPRDPWFNEQIKHEKLKRKKLEKAWRADKTLDNRLEFQQQRNYVSLLIERAKKEYYSLKIEELSGDQKALFGLIKSLCGQNKDTPLPPHDSVSILAEDFSAFFIQKIEDIREKLDSTPDINHGMAIDPQNTGITPLSDFTQLSESEVRKLFMKAATKSCSLDPIPTSLLKNCIDTLLPILTLIVNLSLKYGEFPEEWKLAIILPLIKKLGLDLIFKSYRPVSNLQFVSKVTEKAAESQISNHMVVNKLHYPMQSSYRQGHSTETALLRVQNDVYCAMDNDEVVLLLLLDLSAAFDTLDTEILLQRLENRYRITGTVLQWIRSYLTDRRQSVYIKGHSSTGMSEPRHLKWGVPQGSVLGPVLFTAYTAPLGDLAAEHGVNMHCYADDTQPYLSFKPMVQMAEEMAVAKLTGFINDVRAWMLANKLKLNDDKTMFLLIGRPSKVKKVALSSFTVGNADIPKSDSAVNLGTVWDSCMTMEKQVNNICKTGFLQLRKIAHLRKYLDDSATETIVHAFVTSRIDYCNSLLNGIPSYLFDRVQRLQNAAARIICGLQKFDHITPSLFKLHWLPVRQRVDFKTLLLTYKCVNGLAPEYLSELLVSYKQSYNLRSVTDTSNWDEFLLKVPKTNLKCCGDRAFSVVAPSLWNVLPYELRSLDDINVFKTELKTYLFKIAYNC